MAPASTMPWLHLHLIASRTLHLKHPTFGPCFFADKGTLHIKHPPLPTLLVWDNAHNMLGSNSYHKHRQPQFHTLQHEAQQWLQQGLVHTHCAHWPHQSARLHPHAVIHPAGPAASAKPRHKGRVAVQHACRLLLRLLLLPRGRCDGGMAPRQCGPGAGPQGREQGEAAAAPQQLAAGILWVPWLLLPCAVPRAAGHGPGYGCG
jgi:hypothetical protein